MCSRYQASFNNKLNMRHRAAPWRLEKREMTASVEVAAKAVNDAKSREVNNCDGMAKARQR